MSKNGKLKKKKTGNTECDKNSSSQSTQKTKDSINGSPGKISWTNFTLKQWEKSQQHDNNISI